MQISGEQAKVFLSALDRETAWRRTVTRDELWAKFEAMPDLPGDEPATFVCNLIQMVTDLRSERDALARLFLYPARGNVLLREVTQTTVIGEYDTEAEAIAAAVAEAMKGEG